MTDTVALVVTQEDREATAAYRKLPSPNAYTDGLRDGTLLTQAFARHRIAAEQRARIEGAKAGLEAAAKVADGFCTDRTDDVATGIRNIDPAAIAAIGVDGEVG